MRFRFNKKTQYLLLALIAILGIGSFSQPSDKGSTLPQGIQRVATTIIDHLLLRRQPKSRLRVFFLMASVSS